jgi:putative flippase GtrA
MDKKHNIFTTFIRYNIVAITATLVDFLIFIVLNNIFNIWYVLSTFLSAIAGGIAAFILNRKWTFFSKNNIHIQILKYITVWGGSILLNTYGLYLLVENSTLGETSSKILVSIIVGLTYNFLLSKYYIFK